MLKIHFFNVAEGDAILLEYEGSGTPFRVLVDTGRRILPESPGSLRRTAADHLRKRNIQYIDALVLTHLHVDHVQDLPEILESAEIGTIYSTYFPPDPSLRIPAVSSDLKAVRELPQDLNTLAESVQKAERSGTKLIRMAQDVYLPMDSANGDILIRMPAVSTLDYQNGICDRLFAGLPVTEEEIYRAAKSRNPNSLRLRVTYAGRSVALDGDYYAFDAENEPQLPCDILKVAHHGDKKSMTEKLASMLRPKYAVVSCMREYDAKKDRPSQTALDHLRKYGARIFYTDCFAEEGRQAYWHEEVLITISEDGGIAVF
ncbi:MAG: MBL fold metallo-hydrolase [Flexilinea sp.]|nr:MBL fold metallo-hydrolase [Flexilinea sp.]